MSSASLRRTHYGRCHDSNTISPIRVYLLLLSHVQHVNEHSGIVPANMINV